MDLNFVVIMLAEKEHFYCLKTNDTFSCWAKGYEDIIPLGLCV